MTYVYRVINPMATSTGTASVSVENAKAAIETRNILNDNREHMGLSPVWVAEYRVIPEWQTLDETVSIL